MGRGETVSSLPLLHPRDVLVQLRGVDLDAESWPIRNADTSLLDDEIALEQMRLTNPRPDLIAGELAVGRAGCEVQLCGGRDAQVEAAAVPDGQVRVHESEYSTGAARG